MLRKIYQRFSDRGGWDLMKFMVPSTAVIGFFLGAIPPPQPVQFHLDLDRGVVGAVIGAVFPLIVSFVIIAFCICKEGVKRS